MLPFLLLACSGKSPDDTGPTDTEVALATPTVGIVTPMEYGQLRSTCTLTLDVYRDGDTTTPVLTVSYNARGGDWAGVEAEADVQYDAVGRFDDCINTGDESGSFDASSFSLAQGGLFLFWYVGTLAGFDTLQQETQFHGGFGTVYFEPDAAPTFPDGMTATDEGDGAWAVSWDSAEPVPQAFAPLASQEDYLSAEPQWMLYRPDWWQSNG